jgi:hypothetical protein
METGQYADAIPEFLISLQKNSEDARYVISFSGTWQILIAKLL